jgi:hypothetical protein
VISTVTSTRNAGVNRNEYKTCVYCGIESDRLTRDHVPPKKLFIQPRPTNLITVPACSACNASFSEDDEYFRFAMVTPSFEHPSGRKLWQQSIVPSTFKRHPDLIREMVKRVRTFEVKSTWGLYLGKAQAIPFEWRRINRVLRRITRGLIWHHFQRHTESDKEISIVTDPHPRDIAVQSVLGEATLAGRIGDGSVFAYRYAYVPSRPEASLWILQFYSRLNFIALSIPADLKDDIPAILSS